MEGKPEAELKSRTELTDETSGAGGSRGLDGTSEGDGTKKSGGNIGRERFPMEPEHPDVKGNDSRVGTQEDTGSADHNSTWQRVRSWH